MGIAIAEAMPLKGLNHEPGKKRHHYATKERSRQAIATGDRDAEQEQRPKQQMLPRQHAEQIGDHVGTQVAGIVENAEYATKIMGATRPVGGKRAIDGQHRDPKGPTLPEQPRSEEHTSELQSPM